MKIDIAIKATTEKRPFITRTAWAGQGIKIRPTDSPECCIISSPYCARPSRGWQPTAEDLTAEDWITTG